MHDWIVPDWLAPARVRSCITTRHGGVSIGPYKSLNLGTHVGDEAHAVAANRAHLSKVLGLAAQPVWLNQVHGTTVIDAAAPGAENPSADAAFVKQAQVVCVVMTADCLPVLLCDRNGTVVAAAHAGWRGLLNGVIEATIKEMGCAGSELIAYLGPAIGPAAFEVGAEVREAFVSRDENADAAFSSTTTNKCFASLYYLAKLRLRSCGLSENSIYGGSACTYTQVDQFFSYRRNGITGRMASLIWLED